MKKLALYICLTLSAILCQSGAASAAAAQYTNSEGLQCERTGYDFDTEDGTAIVLDHCCQRDENMQADGSCISKVLADFFDSFWNFVSVSDPGSQGGSGNDGTPDINANMPTREQCKALGNSCQRKAGQTTKSCEDSRMRGSRSMVEREPGQLPGTCFGNFDDVLELVRLKRDFRCQEADLNRGTLCRYYFEQVALEQCISGIKSGSLEISGGGEITIEVVKLDGEVKKTIDQAAGEGDRTYCARVGKEYSNECEKAERACLQKAGGVAPIALPDGADALITRIDQNALGLGGGLFSPNNNAVARRGTFRGLGQAAIGEGSGLYLERLKFLANWSEFIQRQGVSAADKANAQLAFDDAQVAFISAERRLARLTVSYLIPDPAAGTEGERLAKLELLRYTKLGEYSQRLKTVEDAFGTALANALGEDRARDFMDNVWPGLQLFGFAQPMKIRQGETDRN
jgi:hypothetical protein